jgi:geranylgeranyl diphosphate synthase type II
MDPEEHLAAQAARVDRFLEAELPPVDTRPERLHAAMWHAVFPGGKRFRPALVLAAARAAGGDPERALPVAAAVELVHAYSLVHDDLPCMDDDAERRGRPSVHAAWDEATAVLTGDALLAEAFRILLEAGDLEPELRVEVARELARAAGSQELVGGQAEDLAAADGPPLDAETVERIHRRKTAALIRASVVAGARVGGAGPATLEKLTRFGEAAGLAFQIADDVLDGDGSEPCSLVTVLGARAAAGRAGVLKEEALAAVEDLGGEAEPLRELARLAVDRKQ